MGFRVGTTRTCPQPDAGRPVSGVALRAMQERADAAWVLSTHATEADARAEEAIVSLRYRLPTLPFIARKGAAANGLVHDQSQIDRVFESVDTYSHGNQLLLDRHLHFEEPHHVPRTWEGRRRNVTITLCGDRRGRTPMHTVAVGGRDPQAAAALERLGLTVRPAKSGSKGWRYESCFKDFGAAMDVVNRIGSVLPVHVRQVARLGVSGDRERSTASRSPTAQAVRPGMVMFAERRRLRRRGVGRLGPATRRRARPQRRGHP